VSWDSLLLLLVPPCLPLLRLRCAAASAELTLLMLTLEVLLLLGVLLAAVPWLSPRAARPAKNMQRKFQQHSVPSG
jgi:hypothetical protein